MKFTVCSVLLLLGAGPSLSPVARLRAKVPVVGVSDAAREVAGKYSSAHPELKDRRLWLHSGRNLYLFSDQSYIYCEWGDLLDETVYDKGTWHFEDSRIELQSDPEVTWPTRGQRAYVAVRRVTRQEILLVGLDWDLPEFEAHANDRPEFMLLLHSYTRLEPLKPDSTTHVKTELLKRAWNPAFFESKKR